MIRHRFAMQTAVGDVTVEVPDGRAATLGAVLDCLEIVTSPIGAAAQIALKSVSVQACTV